MLLMPDGESTEPIVQLFKSRIKKVEGRGILIVGIADKWKRKKKDSYPRCRAAWQRNRKNPEVHR